MLTNKIPETPQPRRFYDEDIGGETLNELQEVSKEAVGIHVLLIHSLFACDILRRLLRRASSSEIDFCSFAILIARQNASSI